MILKNKKTGEIGRVLRQLRDREEIRIATDKKIYFVESLSQLADEWEDYTVPEKEQYWFYNTLNNSVDYCDHDETDVDEIKDLEIGNHFKTKEEVEEAVVKLKAWKRLKDKGFRFTGWEDLNTLDPEDSLLVNRDVVDGECVIGFRMSDYADCIKDLDLLFGSEE